MANEVNVAFDSNHEGVLESANASTKISFRGNGLEPYELFLGGFASCLHATFIGIAKKKRLHFDAVTYNVVGNKRDEVPTLLNHVKTTIVMSGVPVEQQKAIEKSMALAEKYCSISATINKIAEMEFVIEFN